MTLGTFIPEEDEIEAPNFKYKCTPHKFYTNDRAEFERHKLDKKLSHIEVIRNDTCFHCGEKLDADAVEGIQYRHRINNQSTHKKCRDLMYNDIVNGSGKS